MTAINVACPACPAGRGEACQHLGTRVPGFHVERTRAYASLVSHRDTADGVNVHHLSKSAEYGSPIKWVEIGRTTLGTIDLDPASSSKWNDTVKATRYIDKIEDGLRARGSVDGAPVTVWLNPPGNATGELVSSFWHRLTGFWRERLVGSAVWVGFSLEQLGYLQDYRDNPLNLPTLVPRTRIAYRKLARSVVVDTDAPSHGSYLTLLPDRFNGREQVRTFANLTAKEGACVNLHRWSTG